MNSSKLFSKVFEQSREAVLSHKLTSVLSSDSRLLSDIHQTALNNPTYTVDQVLKMNNATYSQYIKLIKTGFSIPQIRQLHLGKSRELTADKKKNATSRLRLRKKSKNVSNKRVNMTGEGANSVDNMIDSMFARS